MDLCVGKRPKPIGRGALEDFNAVFLSMFEYLQSHERIVTVWLANHDEDPLGKYGSLTVASVRRWLRYNQLVTVEKDKEEYEVERKDCFGEYDSCKVRRNSWCGDSSDCKKFSKNPLPERANIKVRNIIIIRATKRGQQAYQKGQIIKVDWGSEYHSDAISVGLGKPYSGKAYKIYEIIMALWKKAGIAMTRRDKWRPDLREYYLNNLLDKPKDEALKLLNSWASAKAWDWNINHKRKPARARIKDSWYEPPKTQRRLF